MASFQVPHPIPVIEDIDGKPLDDGFIFIGVENLDPVANPVSVFFDEALTIPATQPIRTRSGYPVNAGQVARLYVAATAYSILVRNKNGTTTNNVASAAGPVMADELANASDPAKGAALVGWDRFALTSAIATVSGMLNAQMLNLWEFASLATGYAPGGNPATWDWSPAFQAARTAAALSGETVAIPPLPGGAPYIYGGSSRFVVDLSRFGVRGMGDVVIDCSTCTADNAIQIFSSRGYPDAGYHNNINVFANMAWIGNKTAGRHGLLLGDGGSGTYNGQSSIWHCSFAKFDRNIHFANNSWRFAFYNCGTTDALNYTIYVPASLINSGEVIDFYHCQVYDGAGMFEIAANNYTINMHGCSILNQRILISGSSVNLHLFGGNLENPGAVVYYDYLNITGANSHVTLHSPTLIFNNPSLFTDAPIKIAANSIVDFIGVNFPDGAFSFETGAGTRSICSGAGIARGTDCKFPVTSGGADPNIGYPAQFAANGDFELGTTAGWTSTPTGGGGTAVASAAAAKNGGFGARLTANAASSTISLTQDFNVKPGQFTALGCWCRVNVLASSGQSASMTVIYFDSLGNQLLSSANDLNTTGTFTLLGVSLSRYAPRGAATVRVQLTARNGAEVDFDDVIANLM